MGADFMEWLESILSYPLWARLVIIVLLAGSLLLLILFVRARRSTKQPTQRACMSQRKAVAFIDEAGEKGFVRNLSQNRDNEFGLLCSLLIPLDRIGEFRAAFEPPFERFKREGGAKLEKLHITEAFKPGNENLRPMATEVRQQIMDMIRVMDVPVIYTARRMKLLREAHNRLEQMKNQAKASRRNKSIAIPDRPSDARIEHDLITGLTLRLDALAQDMGLAMIDLATDQIDLPVSLGIEESIDKTRSISFSKNVVKAFDLHARKPVEGSIEITVTGAPFELDVKRVGTLTILGKDDPLIFATDVITNALNDHLSSLGPDQPLNAPSSVMGWSLGDRVWGGMHGAAEDLY